MRTRYAAACLGAVFCFTPFICLAQESDAAKANDLYLSGKQIDALPLYEKLAKQFPNEALYQERLAGCLSAESSQLTDPAEIKAIRTRIRDAAKRAVELGDPNRIMKDFANLDPDAVPAAAGANSPGAVLLNEGEKAFAAGDFKSAIDKYTAALDADPKLYEAALYAGDTAYAQHDLPTAAKWFARAIAIDPNRETAYRYWGDAILKYGNDPTAARDKFIDAIVAEPYKNLTWQGIENWTARQSAVLMPPKIQRPAGPTVDPKNPKNVNITIDFAMVDDKKNPAAAAWMMYPLIRASYHTELFAKEFPDEKEYRHSLKEESAALNSVVDSLKERKIKPDKLDESLRNLLELDKAGMLDCWILLNGADQGIAQDYPAYRKDHRQLLHDYLARFVVHGGVTPR
jgi:tetratricopeptide (TPR) repeat protein